MDIIKISAHATAFIRPVEGVNAGCIHTPGGMIWIDTTSSPAEARSLVQAVGAKPGEIRLVINTHFHNDHTWGNQVFQCPILAQRLCQERMQRNLTTEWSKEALQANLTEAEKVNPKKAEELCQTLTGLQVTLPGQVFEDRYEGELGGVKFEVIHLGGHTPDCSVVWLPDIRVLFASDLIFQGRYPYIFDADIPAWIDQLERLTRFNAASIVPGHGVMCGEEEINTLRTYLQGTWEKTAEHIGAGHSVEEAVADPDYPVFPGEKYERLHQANIRYVYQQLKGKGQ